MIHLLKPKTTVILLALVATVFGDHHFSERADFRLRSQGAHLSNRIQDVALDTAGPRKQGCLRKRSFLIYVYQTCFILNRNSGPAQGTGFDFIYHKPRAFFSANRFISSSYYFGESALGLRLATINPANDGQINWMILE